MMHFVWRALAGTLLMLLLAACVTTPPETPTLPRLALAAKLLETGEANRALDAVNHVLEAPEDLAPSTQGAALRLRGEIYFQLQDYARALSDFSSAIELDRDDYLAVHRRWAASLMADPGGKNRKRVEHEIAMYIEAPDSESQRLLVAFLGYTYLWDRDNSSTVLQRLLKQPPDPALDPLLPDLIVDTMLTTRSPSGRLALAREFVHRYLDHVNLPTVLEMVFDQGAEVRSRMSFAAELAPLRSSNLHVRYYAALNTEAAIETGKLTADTISELVAERAKRNVIDCGARATKRTCEFYRDRLLAGIDVLQGESLIDGNQHGSALTVLKRAVATDATNARAWMFLGRAHAGSGEITQARRALLMSLAIDPELNAAMEALTKLSAPIAKDIDTIRASLASENGAPVFSDITSSAGLSHTPGQRVAWGDFNNDGFDDLLVDGRKLFENRNGQEFVDISKSAGLPGNAQATGGLFVDYDNDGNLDVLVTGPVTVLYRNHNGQLTPAFHFNRGPAAQRRTEAASFGDFNGDGFVDLYLANYEKSGVQRSICDQDQLFINRRGEEFEDQGKLLGIETDVGLCGRGVLWSDLNRDGLSDILVANYRLNRNRMLINRKTVLQDVARVSGMQSQHRGHSIAAVSADFDNDGRPDLYITNLAHPRALHYSERSRLLISHGTKERLRYRERTDHGILFSETNADIAVADVDNDGDVDLFVTAIYPHRYSALYLNNGKGYFSNVSWLSGTQVANGWGAAFSDFDNDGDMDLVVASEDGIRLLRNDFSNYNTLAIRISDPACQPQGVGSRVWLKAGSRTQFREIQAGKGTGTQDSQRLAFGLGEYSGELSVLGINSCGQEYRWHGHSSAKEITIP